MTTEEEKPPIRPRVEQPLETVGAVVLIVLVIVGLLFALNRSRPLDLAFMALHFQDLVGPAGLSLFVTVLAYLTGMGIGFALGWLRTLKFLPARGVATVYVESIRGTPLFVQILFLFSVFSIWSFGLPTTTRVLLTGYLALMINTSAYQAEIFRAGFQSVPRTQVEAAEAIGLRYWGRMGYVILPQAFRVVVPPLTNEFIAMLKASSLLFFIGVPELTYAGRIMSFGGNLVEVYLMVTGLYLLMTVPLATIVQYLERRFRIPGLGFQPETTARLPRTRRGLAARTLGLDGRVLFRTFRVSGPSRRDTFI